MRPSGKPCDSFTEQDLSATFSSPNSTYLLGTDSLGRDRLSSLLYGGRVSLAVGFGVAVVAGLFGTLVGAVAGYFGGWTDATLMRMKWQARQKWKMK